MKMPTAALAVGIFCLSSKSFAERKEPNAKFSMSPTMRKTSFRERSKFKRATVAFLFFAFGRRKGSKMKGYHFHYYFLLSVKYRRIVFRKKQGLNTIYTCKRYHRLTRADNAFQRAIPVCLIQLRPPRSAPPQSPMGNPGYGSAQVNPS